MLLVKDDKVIGEIKEMISQYVEAGEYQYSHIWSSPDHSCCQKCGDKDWYADSLCNVSDNEYEINKGLKHG